jgi:hypothetical protein
VAAGVAVSALLASGCSDGGEPPATLPSLTTSATPSAAVVPRPSGIDAPDAIGASAFTRYWFDVLTAALQTNDGSQLEALSDEGCDSCQNFLKAIESARAKGLTTPDLTYELAFAESSPPEKGKALVDMSWRSSAAAELDRQGRVVRQIKASEQLYGQMLLGRVGDTWSVLGLRTVPRPS